MPARSPRNQGDTDQRKNAGDPLCPASSGNAERPARPMLKFGEFGRIAHFRRALWILQRHADQIGDDRGTPGGNTTIVCEQLYRLADAVGDEHDRGIGVAANIQQQVLHFHARQFVKRTERLIHQQ